MPATQLGIYQDAARSLNERKPASLSENTELRRVLDDVWSQSGITMGAAIFCLEQSHWGFGTRSSALAYNPAVEPPFGFPFAFNKPDDWVRTVAVCCDPFFKAPLADNGYADEAGFWFANVTSLYVKYVSKDASYGLAMALWPMSFSNFLAMYLAVQAVGRITQNESKIARAEKNWIAAIKKAKGIDGSNKPTALAPMGSWASARMAGGCNRNG